MTGQPTVVSLEWLSEEAGEAALTITDGRISVIAFCHPCRVGVGEALKQPLLALDVSRMERARQDDEPSLSRTSTAWGYEGIAKILSHQDHLVSVGALKIELDQPLPGDLKEGEAIHFTCARLDVVG
jgi:hypothetical protein